MPLDPNIILQQPTTQAPDLLGTLSKAMTLRQLSQQGQIQQRDLDEQQAIRDAYANKANWTTGDDGQTTLNQSGLLGQIQQSGKVSPQTAMGLESSILKHGVEKVKNYLDLQADSLANVRDDATWATHRKNMIANNVPDANRLPENYMPTWVHDVYAPHVLDVKTQIDNQQKEKDFALRQHESANKDAQMLLDIRKQYGDNPPPDVQAMVKRLGLKGGSSAAPQSQAQIPASLAANPNAPQALSDIDPATLVNAKVPQHQQEKVYGEIEAAQNTAANKPAILQAFDDAANKIHGADFIPGIQNADQMKLHALLGPTFKDVEGTVRQAAMDNMFENTTPRFGDGADKIAKKRQALLGYMASKSSAPVAMGNHIDLSTFKSTRTKDADAADGGMAPHPQDNTALAWAKTNPKDPRAAAILKVNGY